MTALDNSILNPRLSKKNMQILPKIALIIILSSCLFSCKKSEQETQVEVISGNVTYNSLVKSSAENYFVLDQNKIRLLNLTTPNSLNISSTFPLTEIDFELVRGNKDSLYIQSATGLKIYVLRSGNATNWEEVSVINEVLPCDRFDVNYPFLLTSVKNSRCNFSGSTTELRLYNIAKLDSVFVQSTVTTADILKIQQVGNRGFYALATGGQLTYFATDATATSPQVVLDVPAATNFNIYGEILVVSSKSQIAQYQLTTPATAQLLSTIPVSE